MQSYEIILYHLQELQINSTPFKQIRQPKLSNIEIVTMNFTAEYMGIDSECQLFRVIKGSFLELLIERSVYNRRKRKLFPLIENIRINCLLYSMNLKITLLSTQCPPPHWRAFAMRALYTHSISNSPCSLQ